VEEQVIVIFAGTKGYLDKIAVNQVGAYEQRLVADIRANAGEILDVLNEAKKIDDDLDGKIHKYLETFTNGFVSAAEAA